mgnify:CR=1 FL=1
MMRFSIYLLISSLAILSYSCTSQNKQRDIPEETPSQEASRISTQAPAQDYNFNLSPPPLSQFIRRIFQDSQGSLWMGTNGDGVIRYNGTSVDYFSIDEGFNGEAVRAILEDKDGTLWFGTNRGLVSYNLNATTSRSKPTFINYAEAQGLTANNIWSMLLDSKGTLWIGAVSGINTYDGTTFTPFPLPETSVDNSRGVSSTTIVHSIMEDTKGQLWFASNGGAFIWDGNTLDTLSSKDGLAGNNVNDMLEDRTGNIWFATHHKGVSRYDGTKFTNFTTDGAITGEEVWSLFEDSKGNIWFPAENAGVYKYDGKSFTNYNEDDGLQSNAIQTIYEDATGTIWLGGYQGLSRLNALNYGVNPDGTIDPEATKELVKLLKAQSARRRTGYTEALANEAASGDKAATTKLTAEQIHKKAVADGDIIDERLAQDKTALLQQGKKLSLEAQRIAQQERIIGQLNENERNQLKLDKIKLGEELIINQNKQFNKKNTLKLKWFQTNCYSLNVFYLFLIVITLF